LPRLLYHWFVTDVKSANAIVEAPGEFDQRVERNPEQGLDLLPRQFGPNAETGFNWILKERFAKPRIRYQPPQGPLDTALTHSPILVPWSLRHIYTEGDTSSTCHCRPCANRKNTL